MSKIQRFKMASGVLGVALSVLASALIVVAQGSPIVIPPFPQASPSITISALNPSSGPVGTIVTVVGSGFTSSGNLVSFGDSIPAISGTAVNATSIFFIVPKDFTLGCQPPLFCPVADVLVVPGTYNVSVINGNGQFSNKIAFTVTGSAPPPSPSPQPVCGVLPPTIPPTCRWIATSDSGNCLPGRLACPITTSTISTVPIAAGDIVKTIAAVNVRRETSLFSKVRIVEASGATGIVLRGPKGGSGNVWYKVRFADSVVGWVSATFLVKS